MRTRTTPKPELSIILTANAEHERSKSGLHKDVMQ